MGLRRQPTDVHQTSCIVAMTKICVLGAGALGSLVGGLIQHHDPQVEVVMVARGEHGRRMRERGTLLIKGPWGWREVKVRICHQLSEIDGCELALLTVKSKDTAATIQAASRYLGSAVVVSLQNGINQRVLAGHLSENQFLVGMTATNTALLEPGTVSLQRDGITVIGSTANAPPRETVSRALGILRKSGLRMESQGNIEGVQLNKIAMNAIGYTSVLSRSNFLRDCILGKRWRREVAKPLLDECFSVFDAAGIQLEVVRGPSDARRFRKLLDMLDRPLFGQMFAVGIRAVSRRRIVYSVEQDLMRGQPTEIDYVNGEIVRLAELCGMAAPLNAKVVQLVHDMERHATPRFLVYDEVIEQIRAARL